MIETRGTMQRLLVFVAILLAYCGFSQSQLEGGPLPDWLVFMKQFKVDIQVREPSGVQVWTRFSPKIEQFGIELYVGNETVHGHDHTRWDRQLFRNTTVVRDGKFFIEDPDIIIRKHETIRFRFSVLHKRVLSHSPFRRMVVGDHLFFRPRDYSCMSECLTADEWKSDVDVTIVRNILLNEITACVGHQASEYLIFPLEGATQLVADAELFVKSRLWQVPQLRLLLDNVETCHISHTGVGFKMRTMIDKLKVLVLGEDTLGVKDFDSLLQRSTDNK